MENTPPPPRIHANLDTNLLKLIAVIAMACDHAGLALFPQFQFLRLIGRIAFPLFAYCLVVGSLYTHDIRRYMLRLGIFALVSQPFYILLADPDLSHFVDNLPNLNIFFTLLAGLGAITALQKQNWWLLAFVLTASYVLSLDYGLYGVALMLLFYCFRFYRGRSALAVTLYLAAQFFTGGLPLDGTDLGLQGFAVLAVPLIYCNTAVYPKIPRYFFYGFYPAHMLLLYLIRLLLSTVG